MNKKQLLVGLTFLLFSCQFVFAQEAGNPIDKKLSVCMAKNSTTAGMVECEKAARKEWDTEMNKYYKLLMGILNKEEQDQLKKSQLAWLKYRDLEMEFRGHSILNLQGTMWIPVASGVCTDVVKQRALELKSHYGILQEARKS